MSDNPFSNWLHGKRQFDPNKKYEYYEDTHVGEKYVGNHGKQQYEKYEREAQQPSKLPPKYSQLMVFYPQTPEDVQELINFLRSREPAILNLTETEPEISQRVLDFASGAIFALGGTIHRITKGADIFCLTAEGVEILDRG